MDGSSILLKMREGTPAAHIRAMSCAAPCMPACALLIQKLSAFSIPLKQFDLILLSLHPATF